MRRIWMGILWVLASSAAARDLTLEQALALAEKNASELKILDAEFAIAQGMHQRTAQAFLPKISLDATRLRADSSLINEVPISSLPGPVRKRYRDFGPVEGSIGGIQVIQPVWNADAIKARGQARRGVQARRLACRWGRRVLRFQVVRSYYAVAVNHRDEQAARMALEAARQSWRMANAAYREGLVARLDVLRAESAVEAARARLRTAEADLREAGINLATLLGLPPQESITLLTDFPQSVPPVEGPVSSGERFDLAAWEAKHEAAAFGVGKARAGRLPRLNLLGRRQWVDGDEPLERDAEGWLVALYLQWRLFDGMDRHGEIAEARARKSRVRAELEQARRNVAREQQRVSSTWTAAWSAWKASGGALEAAQNAGKLAQRQYEEGLGNMSDLLATQADLYRRRLENSRYRYDLLLASMNYYLRHGLDPLTVLPEEIRGES